MSRLKYQTDVSVNLPIDSEHHEAIRQRGHALAKEWIDGEHGEVLKTVKRAPRILAATFLSLLEADFIDEAALLCERVMGITKSDE